ncbi:MAG: HAD-IB family phosphatase, partial [bacterium]|nr:HAD-IB family phosphatase [bacterium]
LEKYAPREWKDLDDAVWRGELSEREAFQRQIALLRVTWEEARAALLKGVRIREGFPEFVSFCRSRGIPLRILSSGLRELIDVLLQSVGVSGIPVRAHHAEISGDRWRVKLIDLPRLAEHCSHCKCVTVLAQKQAGKVIYIGDGYTDLCPVQHADMVFATGRLAQECAARGRPFIPFHTFFDIEHELERLIEPEQDLRR